jgi:hypothetical protein
MKNGIDRQSGHDHMGQAALDAMRRRLTTKSGNRKELEASTPPPKQKPKSG